MLARATCFENVMNELYEVETSISIFVLFLVDVVLPSSMSGGSNSWSNDTHVEDASLLVTLHGSRRPASVIFSIR